MITSPNLVLLEIQAEADRKHTRESADRKHTRESMEWYAVRRAVHELERQRREQRKLTRRARHETRRRQIQQLGLIRCLGKDRVDHDQRSITSIGE